MRASKVDHGDAAEKYLGKLCPKGHSYNGIEKSLRYRAGRACFMCNRESSLEQYRKNAVFINSKEKTPERKAYEAQWKRRKRALYPDEAKAISRERYQKDHIKIRLRNRLRKALVAYATQGKTTKSSEYADFMAIIRHLGPCPGELSEWEIDHIMPLCSFDFSNVDKVRAAFLPENHQWLTKDENRKKSWKVPPLLAKGQ